MNNSRPSCRPGHAVSFLLSLLIFQVFSGCSSDQSTAIDTRIPFVNFAVSLAAPHSVAFTEQNIGGTVSSRHWYFGDGDSATSRNPTHRYAATGTYRVTLVAEGPGGTDTVLRKVFCSDSYAAGASSEAALTIFYPNGGEKFRSGDTVTVRYGILRSDLAGYPYVQNNLDVGLDSGLNMHNNLYRLPIDTLNWSWRWIIPDSTTELVNGNFVSVSFAGSACLLVLHAYGNNDPNYSDETDGYFSISPR
jgi:PKD repeat protein